MTTQPTQPTQPVFPILTGPDPDPNELYANFRPIKYRYVMAYLHDTTDPDGTFHPAGQVMDVLPMTQVSYEVGFYAGTQMTGQIYLPTFYLDEMPNAFGAKFDRMTHPDALGNPVGAQFECGNRAIYVMRNEEVVWGGILWTRSYSSGGATMTITALSWEGYVYYRLLRRSIAYPFAISVYMIWYAVLMQTLTDFTWPGFTFDGALPSPILPGLVSDAINNPDSDPTKFVIVPWTGLSRDTANAPARNFIEQWPYNSPHIEMPPQALRWMRGPTLVTAGVEETFRGYDMNKVGDVLQQWADTETIATDPSGLTRFEYRVVCWFDESRQKFRQRYIFGEMTYAPTSTDDDPLPNGILRELIGQNTREMVDLPTNKIVFDFPGQISEWSLNESMEEAVTRVIVTDDGDAAAKHAEYAVQSDLLNVGPNATQGWMLYDLVTSYGTSVPSVLQGRAARILSISHVPEAAQISDLAAANTTPGQRASHRSTDLSVTLYRDPSVPFAEFNIGDWATFAIEDPFYGGKMYLQRRIVGYTVTVIPDQESDYSHEQIQLQLTDETKVAFS